MLDDDDDSLLQKVASDEEEAAEAEADEKAYSRKFEDQDRCAPKNEDVEHWVIFPQYTEDVGIVCLALASVCRSRLARSSICIILAMEEREAEARQKVCVMRRRFADKFLRISATYHPANLPNDPPGKASNTAWAFRCLLQSLKNQIPRTRRVLLTVADADSEFHHRYFEALEQHYFSEPEEKRDYYIWQAPVLHVKNYRRQPALVTVGTIFTCMDHLAQLADPNAVRFPYSTYSLSLALAVRVGGWDTHWIAEDWHMGIKCFLLTLGQAMVKPIMLPTLNYAPEDTTWYGTLVARWAQAKRHALGFSDLSYYYMMLPLVFSYLASSDVKSWVLSIFQVFTLPGIGLVVKIVNTHVALGVGFSYTLLTLVLRELMGLLFSKDRAVSYLIDSIEFSLSISVIVGGVCVSVVAIMYVRVFTLLRDRIEDGGPNESCIFRYHVLHAVYLVTVLILFGCFFYLMITVATFKAACSVLVLRSFEYEVAAKPKTDVTAEKEKASNTDRRSDAHENGDAKEKGSDTAAS
jgi:hypothetical protein